MSSYFSSKLFRMVRPAFVNNCSYARSVALCISVKERTLFTSSFFSANIDDSDEGELGEQMSELKKRIYRHASDGHQVLVIQPYVKWGRDKKRNTTPQLMLEESIGLVESLPNWKVVNGVTISLDSLKKKQVFGKGNLEEIQKTVRTDKHVTAVFISIDRITGGQRRELEQQFRVPVYDRYSVVLSIFRERAKTKEAKLQVALAEVPYLRSLIREVQDGDSGGDRSSIGGSGETFFETRRRLLLGRERKVRDQLEAIRGQRERVRASREKRQIPIVSVVGYTNAGKTSLIRSLTDDLSVVPEDRLFATLDITAHAGYLPCNLQLLYIDTVGFLSELPTGLIEAFAATLEDALHADAIIHVRDISHPETEMQLETVNSTLASLNLPERLRENTILVANKVDKLIGPEATKMPIETLRGAIRELNLKPEDGIPMCATRGLGLKETIKLLQDRILASTGRLARTFRIPCGGEAYQWFNRECAVIRCIEDRQDSQMVIVEVIIHEATLGRLRKVFPKIQMLKVMLNFHT